jgi:hypothetical protein
MYSGGGPYFTMCLPRLGQQSSCFAVGDPHWIVVGLDTSWAGFSKGMGMMRSGCVDAEQLAWLDRILAEAKRSGRRLVLLSHHQPLHFNGGGDEEFVSDLAWLLASGLVVAWLWGHEHFGVRYCAHPRYGFHGRCLGHGGIPEHRDGVEHAPTDSTFGNGTYTWKRLEFRVRSGDKSYAMGALAIDGPNLDLPPEVNPATYGPHGWVELTFEGERLSETWYLAHDHVVALPKTELSVGSPPCPA